MRSRGGCPINWSTCETPPDDLPTSGESVTEDDFVAGIRADIAGETDVEFDNQLSVCLGD